MNNLLKIVSNIKKRTQLLMSTKIFCVVQTFNSAQVKIPILFSFGDDFYISPFVLTEVLLTRAKPFHHLNKQYSARKIGNNVM